MVTALDGRPDCRHDLVRLEAQLLVVEAQRTSAGNARGRIAGTIPVEVFVISAPIDLKDQGLTDQKVDSSDPDQGYLLPVLDTGGVEQHSEHAFEPALGTIRSTREDGMRPRKRRGQAIELRRAEHTAIACGFKDCK